MGLNAIDYCLVKQIWFTFLFHQKRMYLYFFSVHLWCDFKQVFFFWQIAGVTTFSHKEGCLYSWVIPICIGAEETRLCSQVRGAVIGGCHQPFCAFPQEHLSFHLLMEHVKVITTILLWQKHFSDFYTPKRIKTLHDNNNLH